MLFVFVSLSSATKFVLLARHDNRSFSLDDQTLAAALLSSGGGGGTLSLPLFSHTKRLNNGLLPLATCSSFFHLVDEIYVSGRGVNFNRRVGGVGKRLGEIVVFLFKNF